MIMSSQDDLPGLLRKASGCIFCDSDCAEVKVGGKQMPAIPQRGLSHHEISIAYVMLDESSAHDDHPGVHGPHGHAVHSPEV